MGKYNNKYTLDEVREIIRSKGYELISDEYVNNRAKLTLKDNEGYYYEITLTGLLNNNTPYKFHTKNKYTIQNMKLWLNYNSTLELISKDFKYIAKNLIFRDFEGYYYETSFANLLCGKYPWKFAVSNPYTIQNNNLYLKSNNKNIKLISSIYEGNIKKLKWQCLKEDCCEIFDMLLPDVISNNCGCPYCAGQKVGLSNCLATTHPDIAKEWHITKNDDLTPYNVTCGSGKFAWFKCNKCNYEWFTKINYRNDGCGCPRCKESKGEKQLDETLSKYNVPHDSQYKFNDLKGIKGGLLRFDVPVFWDKEKKQLRMLIEYDGKQHFEWQDGLMTKEEFETLKIHDQLKNTYCQHNNINLLRIPYWDFDNIESILQKELNINKINNSENAVVFN